MVHVDNTAITHGRLLNRYFILVCFIGVSYNFAMNLFNSSISLYIDSLGGSTALAGMLSIPFACSAIVFRIISGYTTDHLGRRITMIIGCGLFAIAAYLFGAVPIFAALMVSRGLMGAAYSFVNTAAGAANVDAAPPEKLETASGLFYLPSALSQALAGSFVLYFADKGQFVLLYNIIAIVLLAGLLFSILCNYEKKVSFKVSTPAEATQYRGLKKYFDTCAIKPAICSITICIASCLCSFFALKYASDYNIASSGMFFTIVAVVMLLLNLFNGQIVKLIGRLTLLLICCSLFAVCALLLALTHLPVFFFALAVGYGAIFGGCFPVLFSLALENAAPNRRGAASGTIFVANDIGVGAGSAMWGILIDKAGWTAAFVICAIFVVMAIILCVSFFRKLNFKEVTE